MTVESAEPSAFHQRWMRERPEDYGENVRFIKVGHVFEQATDFHIKKPDI